MTTVIAPGPAVLPEAGPAAPAEAGGPDASRRRRQSTGMADRTERPDRRDGSARCLPSVAPKVGLLCATPTDVAPVGPIILLCGPLRQRCVRRNLPFRYRRCKGRRFLDGGNCRPGRTRAQPSSRAARLRLSTPLWPS